MKYFYYSRSEEDPRRGTIALREDSNVRFVARLSNSVAKNELTTEPT